MKHNDNEYRVSAINYDSSRGRYTLELPLTVVERLLLDTATNNVFILCHKDKRTLDEFANEIHDVLENIEKHQLEQKNKPMW